MAKFRVGDVVEMTVDALENYGEKWAGIPLKVTRVSTAYMPAVQFFANGKPEGFHPGYDECVKGEGLNDLEQLSGTPLTFSLYDYELEMFV